LTHISSTIVAALLSVVGARPAGPASTQPIVGDEAFESVRAVITTDRPHLNTGDPIWVDLMLRNTSDRSVTLTVPNAKQTAKRSAAMGLPLDHVFSGERFRALSVVDGKGKELGSNVMYRPMGDVSSVTLGARAVVGIRVEMGEYYSSLRRSGTYVLRWCPYDGRLESNPLRIELVPLKEVVMVTNMGNLRIQLLYDKAPNHVANFLELVGRSVYNTTHFFRLYRGAAVLGGDPKNDGSGMRKDGKTIKAELNDVPFEEGTLGMSLAGDDPDSASCQFFISLRRIKQWDRKYTAFAKVTGPESLETLRRIGQVEVDERDRPIREIILERVDVKPVLKTGMQERIIRGR